MTCMQAALPIGTMRGVLLTALLVSGGGAAHAENATYAIDPTHTFVTFDIDHAGLSTVRARFDRTQGTVTLDKAGRTGAADITIDLGSVSTGVPALDTRLTGKDFLNAAEVPTARFVADRFGFDGDKVTDVAGTLTLLGRSRPVTLKAIRFNCYFSPMLRRETCGGDFEATLVRSQFGMLDRLDAGVSDQIRLLIQIEAIRQ